MLTASIESTPAYREMQQQAEQQQRDEQTRLAKELQQHTEQTAAQAKPLALAVAEAKAAHEKAARVAETAGQKLQQATLQLSAFNSSQDRRRNEFERGLRKLASPAIAETRDWLESQHAAMGRELRHVEAIHQTLSGARQTLTVRSTGPSVRRRAAAIAAARRELDTIALLPLDEQPAATEKLRAELPPVVEEVTADGRWLESQLSQAR